MKALWKLAVWIMLGCLANGQERRYLEALETRDIATLRSMLGDRSNSINREEWLAKAVKDDPLLVSLLLTNGADPIKPIPSLGGLNARDAAFASCNPKVMPIVLGAVRDATPVDWKRPVTEGASAKRIILEIGLMSCRLRCTTVNGSDGGPGCFPDQLMNQISERARYLMGRWGGAAWKQSVYDNALLSILSVLQGFALRPDERRMLAVKEAVLDFQTIAEDCERGPTGAGRLIPISVQTVDDSSNQANAGWQVLYKRKLFEMDDTVEFEVFPTLSSPATAKLPPGRYVVVARKGKLATAPTTYKTAPDAVAAWQIPVNRAVEK